MTSSKAREHEAEGSHSESPLVVGLDIGTSSVRGLVYDALGRPVEGLESHRPYEADVGNDGGVTIQAERLTALVFDVLDELEGLLARGRLLIAGVGTSCFWHSLLLLDHANRPVTPVLLWADNRSASMVAALKEQVDEVRLHQRTGARIHPSYWPAKLAWLQSAEPAVIARASRIVSYAEYLCWLLFGRFRVGVSMASGTGLLNVTSCRWDEYALGTLALPDHLRLSSVSESRFSHLNANLRSRWPSLGKAPWFPPLGDGACSNVGAAGLAPRRFVLTVGTSSAIRTIVADACTAGTQADGGQSPDPALWRYRVDTERTLIGGALSEGGNLVAWLLRVLQIGSIDEAEREITARPPDAGHLTILPFVAGQRSPDWAASAHACIAGIDQGTTALDILHAALESVAYQLRTVYDHLGVQVGEPEVVLATGAALGHSRTWTQIIADVLERPLILSPVAESSSRGAALLALAGLGRSSFENIHPLQGVVVSPRPDVMPYVEARRRQAQLYQRVMGSADE